MSSRILPEFELLMPQSIAEAMELLKKYGEKAVIMAGGTDVMVLMKNGFKPEFVLSLTEIPGLNYIEEEKADGLRIGAMTTVAQTLDSSLIEEKYPALWQSAVTHGTPQTRNAATVVGNILRASPAGDCSCAVLAHGGTVVLEGPDGRREVDIDDFWLGYQVTARKPDEIALEIKLANPGKSTVSAFGAQTRTSLDCSKINAAASLSMNGKICEHVRLAIGSVAPTLLRLKKTEELLKNTQVTEDVLQRVADSVPTEINPIDDVRSTREYRLEVSGVLIRRTIQKACSSL